MAEMLKKVVLHSVATALASRVLPAPGVAVISKCCNCVICNNQFALLSTFNEILCTASDTYMQEYMAYKCFNIDFDLEVPLKEDAIALWYLFLIPSRYIPPSSTPPSPHPLPPSPIPSALTCARRTIEQDAPPRLEPSHEELRVLERVHDRLFDQPLGVLHPQDVRPVHLGVLDQDLLRVSHGRSGKGHGET